MTLTYLKYFKLYVALDGNKAPEANAGPDVFVKLPNRAAALDGSSSSDDYGIVSYSWTRDLKSPAAGVSFVCCKTVKCCIFYVV